MNGGDDARGWPAAVVGVGVVVPAVAGLVAALAADRVDADDNVAIDQLSRILTVNSVVVVGAHVAALVATWALTRDPRLRGAMLGQPALVFAALRVVGAAVLACGVVWPALRQPLAGFAVALVDAAYVASALAVVAPLCRAPRRASAAAVVYVGYRLVFAAAPFAPAAWATTSAWLHRGVSVVVVGAVAAVFFGAARGARAAP